MKEIQQICQECADEAAKVVGEFVNKLGAINAKYMYEVFNSGGSLKDAGLIMAVIGEVMKKATGELDALSKV